MGGEQAASVLATVHRDADKWTPEQAEAFKQPIRDDYEAQGNPWHATVAAVGRRDHRPGADARCAGAGVRRDAECADPRAAAVRRVQDVMMKLTIEGSRPVTARSFGSRVALDGVDQGNASRFWSEGCGTMPDARRCWDGG